MLRPPEALRESLEGRRAHREGIRPGIVGQACGGLRGGECLTCAQDFEEYDGQARSILAHLRALRGREERKYGVKGGV